MANEKRRGKIDGRKGIVCADIEGVMCGPLDVLEHLNQVQL